MSVRTWTNTGLVSAVATAVLLGGCAGEGGEAAPEMAAFPPRAVTANYERAVSTAMHEASDAMTGVRASRDQVIAEQTRTGALRRAFELAELRQLIAAVQLYKALGGTWEP